MSLTIVPTLAIQEPTIAPWNSEYRPWVLKRHLHAEDLEEVLALYEPDAPLMTQARLASGILHRQPDGTWKVTFADQNGRADFNVNEMYIRPSKFSAASPMAPGCSSSGI